MKKLTFKVSPKKDYSFVSLIKEVNKISCQIYLDLQNGVVTVENVNDTMIDTVIELVSKYYSILGVNVDNTFEEATEKNKLPLVTETVDKTVKAETVEANAEHPPAILEPQSEDDLLIKKVEFRNKYIEDLINKFLKTAAWAMFKMNISENEIGDFIYTSINEISIRYNKKDCIKFSVGDVVDCNYGTHLVGEINGNHVPAVVCNISSTGMAYIVPFTKALTEIGSNSYMTFNVPEDVSYEKNSYEGGTALLDKAKYVRAERFNTVIGRVTPAFFEKLLRQLASTFDFTRQLVEVVETPTTTGITADEVVETSAVTEQTANKIARAKATTKKVSNEEAALLEVIGFALDKLDTSKKVEEQIESFLTDIGMTSNERMVTQAFIVACNIKKINYENVVHVLHEIYPKVNEDIIKSILKETFKNWLKQYPTLADKCCKISLMAVLKVFAKKFS